MQVMHIVVLRDSERCRDKAWEEVEKASPDGIVHDPKTGRPMSKDEPWDMGHKPGYEFRKHRASARERGITRKQFLDEHNNPSHYRPNCRHQIGVTYAKI